MNTKSSLHRTLAPLLILSLLLMPVPAAQAAGKETMQLFAAPGVDPLANDGALTWNSFLGGSDYDFGLGTAIDGSGNVYITGYSFASWGTPLNPYAGEIDAYVARLDSSGALVWNTFLGGSDYDYGYGIAVDGSGNVYVTGESHASWGTPVNPYAGGVRDAFVAKLNSSGGRVWNTFLGGSSEDYGDEIAVDGSGNIYIAGNSYASWGTPVRAFAGGVTDAFVAKLNSSGGRVWNTFLGGDDADYGSGIAADGSGNVYVTGGSAAGWGTPVRAFAGGDAFVARLDNNGILVWNTFLGGSDGDFGHVIAVGGSGNLYIAGESGGGWGTPINPHQGSTDVFVARLGSNGTLVWNTFLGGSDHDLGNGLALDGRGNVYVVGCSHASWGTPLNPFAGIMDAFGARLDDSGMFIWNTFIGGDEADCGTDITVDGSGNSYLAGLSYASWGTPVRAFAGEADAFVVKLNSPTTITCYALTLGHTGSGADPIAAPANSAGCDAGEYTAGQVISLTASPAAYWHVRAWTGTDNDSSTASTNSLIMPPSDWAVSVLYLPEIFKLQVVSQAVYDGWILESADTRNKAGAINATAPTFFIGDTGNDREFRSILSFNTSELPDNAVIMNTTLNIKTAGVVGINPFTTHGSLLVDVRTGPFNSRPALEPDDFQAASSKDIAMKITKNPVNGWYSGGMAADNFIYINKAGITQFRLRFARDDNDDLGADYIKFYSGNALTASYRPQLIIAYYIP